MTRVVGLTGAIGAGKSEALAALQRLGAETFSSDAAVRELLATDELRDRLVEHWGERVAPGGAVDRSAVAEIVFEDSDERKWLESQLHPRVAQRMSDWRAAIDPATEVAVVEVPLLYENGLEQGFDQVIVVTAGDDLRRARVAERGDAAVEGRQQAQLSQDEKASRADHVVANDGTLEGLERKLAVVVERIKASGTH